MSQPSKTVRVNRSTLDAIRVAGQKMSNLCFNLSQMPHNKHAREMQELYREWDEAALRLHGETKVGKP